MSQKQFDAIVVGAGTSGAIAASTLAESNAKVLLLDIKAKTLIGKKVCGDALGLHHIRNLNLSYPPKETIKGKINSIRIYSPSKKYSVLVEGEGLALDRHLFGQWLLDMVLDKGVELMDNTRADKIAFENGKGTLLRTINLKTQEVNYIRAKYFVDTSGYTAVLRKQVPDTVGLEREIHLEDINVAYREVWQTDSVSDPGMAKIMLDQDLAPGGYWWYFPQNENTVNIGVGVQGGRRVNPKEMFKRLVTRDKGLNRIKVLDSGGGIVPTRRSLYTIVACNILFAGDAACAINPISGGGIGPSMISGKACGQAVTNALNESGKEDEILWRANKYYVMEYGAHAASLDVFRLFLQTLTNEDIEFGMMKRLVSDEDISDLSYGRADLPLKEKTLRVIRGISKPSLLKNLVETANYMKLVKEEYQNFPDYSEFPLWVKRVDELYGEYAKRIAHK